MSPLVEAARRRLTYAAFAATLAIAAALRFHLAMLVPPWFAEIYVLKVAARSFGEMIDLARADIGPPLQLVLRWIWIRFGGGDGALWQKSLSIVFALGSMVFTFVVARRAFGSAAALFGALLIALHPAHVQYSAEIDDYSLTWLTIAAMIAAAWAWSERESRRGAMLYVGAAAIALYTDYVALLVWPVMALAVGFQLPGAPARRRTWLLLNVAVLGLFVPQIPIWFEQLARESYGRYWRFPSLHALAGLWTTLAFNSRWALLLMTPLALVPLFRAETRRFAILLWAILITTPFSTRVWVVLLPREVLFMAPLLATLAAGGIAAIPSRALRWVPVTLLLAFAVRAARRPPVFTEAAATGHAAEFVAKRARSGDFVVHAEPHSLFYFTYAHPGLKNRLLRDPRERLPFFEGGLAVPDSLYMTAAQWRAEIASRDRWWGVWVNRALATKGQVWRAGAAEAESLRAAAGDSVWTEAPVTVWEAKTASR